MTPRHQEHGHAPVRAEFSRPARLGQVTEKGLRLTVEAKAEERAALMRRFDLLALDKLEAELEVRRLERGDLYEVTGRFSADLAQECVVTTDPVPLKPSESFTMLFTTDPAVADAAGIDVDAEAEDPPELIEGDAIDLGEAVVQQMAMALDPYPRAPDAPAVAAEQGTEGEGDEDRPNPFAVLSRLRK